MAPNETWKETGVHGPHEKGAIIGTWCIRLLFFRMYTVMRERVCSLWNRTRESKTRR